MSLHVCHTTDRRGAELSCVDLVRALRELGVRSKAIALQPGTTENPLDLPVLGTHGRTPLAVAHLRKMTSEHDFVIAHGASTLLATYLSSMGSSTPYVYRMIGDPRFWGAVRFHDLRIGRPLRRAAQVVTLWQGAADAVIELHGVAPERVQVIVNGRDPGAFRPPTPEERHEARARFGLPADGTVVGLLGALRWEKDPLRAVEALRDLPDVHLAIAGDGPLRADVERAAASLGGRVSVLGAITDPQPFHWAIAALLLTSRSEGLPVTEGGLCGVPAVAPDGGGTADLVDEQTGRLVAADSAADVYAEALGAVLADAPARGRSLLERCHASFTTTVAADQWLELFSQLRR